ncbi:cytochrome P450 monooxygenase [Aspergillus luchuensis]|uniref:Cytochrome P450 monooxygenase n=1 Tax=Aspergillus kawachii TaxID=1069201 RepID=A0A146F3F9_ASPKA|nr:cytochrome P450 monooxygenase [Aspergillus luchuensis]
MAQDGDKFAEPYSKDPERLLLIVSYAPPSPHVPTVLSLVERH